MGLVTGSALTASGPPIVRVNDLTFPTAECIAESTVDAPGANGGRIAGGVFRGSPGVFVAAGNEVRFYGYGVTGDWTRDPSFPSPTLSNPAAFRAEYLFYLQSR